MSFATFGNDLYSGKRAIPVVGQRRRFYLGSLVSFVIAAAGLFGRGLNMGLEFRGGSEFRVATVSAPASYESQARDAVTSARPGIPGINITKIGAGTIRVQTERLNDQESADVRTALAETFEVTEDKVSASFVGPSWGASVTQKAIQALIIFLLLTALVLAIYFRTWKMSLAALVALGHDLVIVVGIYALTGLEISPATMIGFLTVLGYSIYDTVVVFDKVRENTAEALANGRMSYADAANLAVNQTMVRSINTTMVGILPIVAVLVVGAIFLGPGVLLDLSVVLFVGMVIGAYSSIFIATPVLVSLRAKEPKIVELEKRAARHQAAKAKVASRSGATTSSGVDVLQGGPTHPLGDRDAMGDSTAYPSVAAVGTDAAESELGSTVTGRAVHRYASGGPRNQPKRPPKSKR